MTQNTLSFPLEVNRGSAIETSKNAFGEGARFGKPTGEGLVQDNGVLIGIDSKMKITRAAKMLGDIYTETRALPERPNKQAGAASASAMLIEDGVVVRSAGDAPVLVIGDNGNVMLLNDFHAISKEAAAEKRELWRANGKKVSDTAFDEAITHCLKAGQGELHEDFSDFVKWETLEEALGTDKMRVLAVSDGVYGKKEHEDIAKDIKDLLNGLEIDDPDFSKKVMRRTIQSDAFKEKIDDVIVLSAMRPEPQQSILLHALDGISGGGEASAKFVKNAIDAAKWLAEQQTKDMTPPASLVASANQKGSNTSRDGALRT